MPKKRVAVVGAGISGLVCAYELDRAGFDVTVFEKRAAVGGRMATRTKDGLPFDIGANHLCDLYLEMKKYCLELGLEWKKMDFNDYGLFKDGAIVPIEKSVSPWSRFRLLLGYPGKRRVENIFNLSEAAEHDTDTGYAYARRTLGKQNADYLADGFTSTYQFHGAEEISRGALIGVMDSLRHEKAGWKLHRIGGGMSALPEALAARLHVRKGTPATAVVAKEEGVEVTARGMAELYDAVVLAGTANVSLDIYKNPTSAQRTVLAETRYSATVSVAFRLPAAMLPRKAVVWVPGPQSKIICSYANETMKGDGYKKDGQSLVCVWLHDAFARTILDKSDREIFRSVKRELVRVCPWVADQALLVPYDLERWPQAMPKFQRGHLQRVKDFLENGQGARNVFLCGDYMNSLWTEGSLRGGQRVAEAVRRSLAGL